MNPISVTQRLKEALTRYLLTTFDVNRDGQNLALYQEIRKQFEKDKALMTGPYLELAQPYLSGKTTHQLIDKGVLSRRLSTLTAPPVPLDIPLYLHQQVSIERIVAEHSVIVSSGTGSGKTESFLLPILSDLLERPANGVRALLIYPLNALVNDQLRRLSETLVGTNITYGRYTSELEKTTRDAYKSLRDGQTFPLNQIISREQIRDEGKIPNILITNYAMLEYLLIRPEDSGLFAHPDDWKYIVLDEAHSYTGAKGIEVAYLIRRLKQRLGKSHGEMICIGTSATLTDNKSEAIDFAQTLFGETFTDDDIIFGKSVPSSEFSDTDHLLVDVRNYLSDEWDEFLEGVRSNTLSAQQAIKTLSKWEIIAPQFSIESTDLSHALHHALATNGHVRALLSAMCEKPDTPLGLAEAASLLFPSAKDNAIALEEAISALHHLVELCSYARLSSDSPSILPARYHLFARSPQGLWACLNPTCGERPDNHNQPWSKIFSSPRLTCDCCQGAVYPLMVCRECGQVYVKTIKAEGKHHTEPTAIETEKTCYFVWSQVSSNDAMGEEDGIALLTASDMAGDGDMTVSSKASHLCLYDDCRQTEGCRCAEENRASQKIVLYPVVQVETKRTGKRGSLTTDVSSLETCVRCKKSSRIKGAEIATDLTISGSTPLSVLMTELYRQLPESSNTLARQKPGGGRKLLSFYDSRQGAARYAAFLQDVFNQATYLRLVPEVVRQWHTEKDAPLTLTSLTDRVMREGWRFGAFQNTVEEDIYSAIDGSQSGVFEALNHDKKTLLKSAVQARLLAQLTTNYRSRQSLEALGLLAVSYFKTPPDVSELSVKLGLTESATCTLIYELLDTLRAEKVITLPEGVEPQNEVFGRHTGHPRVVRGNPAGNTSLTPWAGTERHRRCRMVSQALKHAKRPNDLESVKTALNSIFDWVILVTPSVLEKSGDGYRLSHGCLMFDSPADGWTRCNTCQRLRHVDSDLPCHRCGGSYQPMSLTFDEDNNYYRHIVQQPMYAMRVEEHTAQLSPEKGRLYQEAFKDGSINVLSCSTTFEMGIDLGDLQAVVMSNVPPNVSNYRQRAGRAGRRASGTAFILTWAQERPHDQIYYQRPTEIIRGQVRIPRIKLANPQIRRRHFNALLLGDLLRYLKRTRGETKTTGAFFDPQWATGRHYDHIDGWMKERQDILESSVSALANMSDTNVSFETILGRFREDIDLQAGVYIATCDHYRKNIEEAKQKYLNASSKEANEWDKQRREAEALLKRHNDEELIDWLSGRGVLPSYSFPLYVAELELPLDRREDAKLRLQRDLSRAIIEFAPGAEIVADKRLWKSAGVRYKNDTKQIYNYRICETCNNIQVSENPTQSLGGTDNCLVCGTPNTGKTHRYLVPDDFYVDKDSGKVAGQYVRFEKVQENRAILIPQTGAAIESDGFVSLSIEPGATLHYINSGRKGFGYKLCGKCGLHTTVAKEKACKKCKFDEWLTVDLGHHVITETLFIQFNHQPYIHIPPRENLDFWHTLLTSLLLGASRSLQIERGDINGALFPIRGNGTNVWSRSLVMFDNVPGGAGYMQDIHKHFTGVVQAALEVVNCPNCTEDTSCNRCLRDYKNQNLYPYLKRGRVIHFLENLLAHRTQDNSPDGVRRLMAIDPMHVLWEHAVHAKKTIRIAAHHITINPPEGKVDSWLDLLSARLRAGVHVTLWLQALPIGHHPDEIALADKLVSMLSGYENLTLRTGSPIPSWHLIIDGDEEEEDSSIAFRLNDDSVSFAASPKSVDKTSIHEGLHNAITTFDEALNRSFAVSNAQLRPKPNTRVYWVKPTGRKVSEGDIEAIQQFFSRSVVSMTVNDPYLVDYERLYHRLGNYIAMGATAGQLKKVTVYTRDAQVAKQDRKEQNRAIEELKTRFPNLSLEVNRATHSQAHDRWIEIVRDDNTKARLYIGRGLDFIRADGTLQETYLVLEEIEQ